MSQNQFLVNRLKDVLNLQKDQELADHLGVPPNILSSWKKSKSQLTHEVINFCIQHRIDLNAIFYQTDEALKPLQHINLIPADHIYSYLIHTDQNARKETTIPFTSLTKNVAIGFQVISSNMEPTIPISSFVMCQELTYQDVVTGSVCVIISKTKGFYIGKVIETNPNFIRTRSENILYEDMIFTMDEIMEVYLVVSNIKNIKH